MPDFGPPTEGYKRFVFPDGKGVYDGHWRGCKRHGQGKFTFANGDVYEGESVDVIRPCYIFFVMLQFFVSWSVTSVFSSASKLLSFL